MPKPSTLEYAAAILLGPRYGLDPWTAKAWPGVNGLSSADRTAVVRATRRGRDIGEARLATAVSGYGHALRDTRDLYFCVHEAVVVGLLVLALGFVAYVYGYDYGSTRALVLAVATGRVRPSASSCSADGAGCGSRSSGPSTRRRWRDNAELGRLSVSSSATPRWFD